MDIFTYNLTLDEYCQHFLVEFLDFLIRRLNNKKKCIKVKRQIFADLLLTTSKFFMM